MRTVSERTAELKSQPDPHLRFHRRMGYVCATMLVFAYVGCKIASIHSDVKTFAIAFVVVIAMLSPLPLYWHEKRRIDFRESTLVIPWEALLAMVLPFIVLIAARSQMPLRDSLFGRLDQSLGVNVPVVVEWTHKNWLGVVFDRTYPLLIPLLVIAALLPAFWGKVKYAREFLLANMAAFAIGLPAFALLPAIGPWHYYHTTPTSAQANCQAGLLALRTHSPFADSAQAAGLVSFPSFHVIWAILCAAALWGFRPLRIPVMLLSGMIVVSTITTGWHYFTDVLAGFAIAGVSLIFAKFCTRNLEF
jgi:membrane-associated phospholipid phosphatase